MLKKIQNLPEKIKKIILWAALAVAGIILFFFFLNNLQNRLNNLTAENLQKGLKFPEIEIPELEMPKFEIPEFEMSEFETLKNIDEE